VIKGTTCLALEIPVTRVILQIPRDLTASRSNTNKHGIDKINITPNIIKKLNDNDLRVATRLTQLERIKSELKRRSYDFPKVLCI
jgi:type II secretory pathway component HofQ